MGHPYDDVIYDIARLTKLEHGWDSYDAPPVSRTAMRRAVLLMEPFTKFPAVIGIPEVGASPTGGVVLRWTTPTSEVTVEVRDDIAQYSVVDTESDKIVGEGELPPTSLWEQVLEPHVLRFTGRTDVVRRSA